MHLPMSPIERIGKGFPFCQKWYGAGKMVRGGGGGEGGGGESPYKTLLNTPPPGVPAES